MSEILSKGVVEAIPEKELIKQLEAGKKLRVKFGADPTKPDLHLGHAVVLWKLRELQDAGHEVTFIIGDFTTKIGDPTGKDKLRPVLTDEDIAENAKSYFEQAGKILDMDKISVVRNSEWLGKMGFVDIIGMARHFTVQQMLSRDTFRNRIEKESPLHVHEILYPIVQAIDSVHLKADLELGGTDQKFNLLAGRQLQEALGEKPQCALLMPILTGLDGHEKMSKSLNNYVGICDAPADMFGKLMSISDEKMAEYGELCARYSAERLEEFLKEGEEDPREAKMNLAMDIIALYHSKEEAEVAKDQFIEVFSKGGVPDDIESFDFASGSINVIELLTKTGLCSSNGEAKRMIQQGGVKVDGEKLEDQTSEMIIENGSEIVVQVGKRKFVKVIGK